MALRDIDLVRIFAPIAQRDGDNDRELFAIRPILLRADGMHMPRDAWHHLLHCKTLDHRISELLHTSFLVQNGRNETILQTKLTLESSPGARVDEHIRGKLAQHTLDSVNVCSRKTVFLDQSEHRINSPVCERAAGILFDDNPRLKNIIG